MFSDVTVRNNVYILIIYRAKPYIQCKYRLLVLVTAKNTNTFSAKLRNFEFFPKLPKFLEFGQKWTIFAKKKFQRAVFKWKSSNFVNFDIWLENMDSQVFRDMNILQF